MEVEMATSKSKSSAKSAGTALSYNEPDTTPAYVNNVRIKPTSDNVFIDFGFVDPFASDGSPSTVLQRVVMNRTTFGVFAKHLASVQSEISAKSADVPVVIMSRCPPKLEK